jgi:hypothetical protein
MKPEPTQVLEVMGLGLVTDLATHVDDPYRRSTLQVNAALLFAVREEFDRATARRVEENRALRHLFAAAAPVVREDHLRARLRDAAATEDSSLLVPDLERTNGELRALLIDLHAHVELLSGDEPRALEEAIWRELCTSTERRRLSLAVF